MYATEPCKALSVLVVGEHQQGVRQEPSHEGQVPIGAQEQRCKLVVPRRPPISRTLLVIRLEDMLSSRPRFYKIELPAARFINEDPDFLQPTRIRVSLRSC